MRPIVLLQTDTGTSSMAVLDHYQDPFNVGLGCVITGTPTYTIQHTFDDVLAEGVTPTWFSHPDLTAQTANADGNYAFPVRAVRVNVTAVGASTDAVTVTVLQAGMPGR